MRFPNQLTWNWFTHQARRRWPKSPPPTSPGCWEEAIAWLRKNRHVREAQRLLKTAAGDRASALYLAASAGLIPERGEALSALLQKASGNRASALYWAQRYGLLQERQAKRA